MKIYNVTDPEFKPYGQVLPGYDTSCLVKAMETIPMPAAGTTYEPTIPALEATCIYGLLQNNAYGGMPVQLGMCWGYSTRLNCLEYKWLLAHPESSEADQGAYVGLTGENIDIKALL